MSDGKFLSADTRRGSRISTLLNYGATAWKDLRPRDSRPRGSAD